MRLGQRIRERRRQRGLTLSGLARQAEISVSYLSQLERGARKSPSADILFRLANALGTRMVDLYCSPAPRLIVTAEGALSLLWGEPEDLARLTDGRVTP